MQNTETLSEAEYRLMTENNSLTINDIIGKEEIVPVQNRAKRRELKSFEKQKTKTQMSLQISLLQKYLYEVVNNPESEFSKSIIAGVKRK